MGVAQQHKLIEVGGAGKRMRAVDGKQEINLEWPYVGFFIGSLFENGGRGAPANLNMVSGIAYPRNVVIAPRVVRAILLITTQISKGRGRERERREQREQRPQRTINFIKAVSN